MNAIQLTLLKGLSTRQVAILKKYLEDLSVLTTIFGKDSDFKAKGGAQMTFSSKYGGGQVRFQNKTEIIEFCTALGILASRIKTK